ncbi:VCBS repeat-containing protein, partial [Leucobacter sp. M11]
GETDPSAPRILSDSNIVGPEGSAFGATMSQVSCDVNGNGTPDLAVGTYMTFDTSPGATGAYLLLDPTSEGGNIEDLEPVRILDSSRNAMGGVDVRCAGDTTGDGFDDLVITVQGQASFVVFGSADFGDIHLDTLGERGRTILGSVTRANGVGDLNGDGRDEIALTDTRGTVTVLAPADLPAESALETAPGTRISGANIDLVSVSRAGDMNGDGREDLAVGSSSWKAPGAESFGTGAIWVITDLSRDVTVGDVAIPGFRIDGPPRGYDLLGTLTVGLGDITGSGYDSLLIGGESDEPKSGSAVVVTGGPDGVNVVTNPLTASGPAVRSEADGAQRGWWLNGIASGDHFGHAVGSARMDGWSMVLASAMDGSIDPEQPSSGYVAAIDSRALVAGTLPLSPSGVLEVADLVAGPVPGGILIPGTLAKQNLGRSFADLTKHPAGSSVTFAAGAPALFSWGEIPSVRVVTLEVPAPVLTPDP